MKVSTNLKRAVFFDRDGIVSKPIDGNSPRKVKEVVLVEDIATVVWAVREKGFMTFIASNQPDISLRKIDEPTRESIENHLEVIFKNNNIIFDAIYYCYHHENGINPKYPKVCNCRKPKPGLLLKAAREYSIDLKQSYFIGDRAMDVKAGFLAGTKTILFDKDNTQGPYLRLHNVLPDFTILNLHEAIKIIS